MLSRSSSIGGDLTTGDLILVVQFVFGRCWEYLSSWFIPGTTVTPASWWALTIVIGGCVLWLKSYLGPGGGNGGAK